MEIYRRTFANQPEPEETLSGRDAEVEPDTRQELTPNSDRRKPICRKQICRVCGKEGHPATYCKKCFNGGGSQHLRKDCPHQGKKRYSCGGAWSPTHKSNCPANGVVCRTCKRMGHFFRCCSNAKQPAHNVEEEGLTEKKSFADLDPNDPRVQLQRILEAIEEESARNGPPKMEEDTSSELAIEEETCISNISYNIFPYIWI